MVSIVIITIIAVMVIIFGILLIFSPTTLIGLAERLNRIIFVLDVTILKRRWLWGVLFFLAGAYMLYVL